MNLKAYLATINMTIKDFSKILDVNPNYLSRVASGKLIPSRRLARDIETATQGQIKLTCSKSPLLKGIDLKESS